ncbi:hypothetical protein HYH03_003983 [Edaphochlamys debaryana]|uniref:Pyrrolo-quinoline quinone repeat domain-containing protein n=1 Tax=Edaphochlamys debaryana TaxID=47281 RepID=A0A835YBI9_9CHLO|nr:hypothetical protein HYH03_003983 [Edaphochlamys debaryana]|eukprot:KAG2498233.1 hypothetical protein HYH03_003983 [Edaphochlamys debaryana]
MCPELLLFAVIAAGAYWRPITGEATGTPPVCWTLNLTAADPGFGTVSPFFTSATDNFPENFNRTYMITQGKPVHTIFASSPSSVLRISIPSTGAVDWIFHWPPYVEILTDGTRLVSAPAQANRVALELDEAAGLLFVVPQNRHVYALDPASGRQVWAWAGLESLADTLTYDSGRLFVTDETFQTYALNGTTGELLWRARLSRRWGTLDWVAGDVLVHSDATGNLFGVDAATGLVRWVVPLHGVTNHDWATTYMSRVPYDKERRVIFLADDAGYLYGIDIRTGRVLWETRFASLFPAMTSFDYRMAVGYDDDGRIFTATAIRNAGTESEAAGGLLAAWNATTGALLWGGLQPGRAAATPEAHKGTPLLVTTQLRSQAGVQFEVTLSALEPSTGEALWTTSLGRRVPTSRYLILDSVTGIFYFIDSFGVLVAMQSQLGVGNEAGCSAAASGQPLLPPLPPTSPPRPPTPPAAPARPDAPAPPPGKPYCWRAPMHRLPLMTPAACEGMAFAHSGDTIEGVDLVTGQIKFRILCGIGGTSQPMNLICEEGIVYVGCTNTDLVAVNATTGHKLWTLVTGKELTLRYPGYAGFPAFGGGVLYFGAPDNTYYALNGSTGEVLWKYIVDQKHVAASSVALLDGIVYGISPHWITESSPTSLIFALNATTGEEVWSRTLVGDKTNEEGMGDVALADGLWFVGTTDGLIQAYSTGPEGGDLVWALQVSERSVPCLTVSGGIVYGNDGGGSVFAVRYGGDAGLELLWSANFQPLADALVSIPVRINSYYSPRVLDGRLYYASNQGLVVLNASDGSVLWTDGLRNRLGGSVLLLKHPSPDGSGTITQVLYGQYSNQLVSLTEECATVEAVFRPPRAPRAATSILAPPIPPSLPDPTPAAPPPVVREPPSHAHPPPPVQAPPGGCPTCPQPPSCHPSPTPAVVSGNTISFSLSLGLSGLPALLLRNSGGRTALERAVSGVLIGGGVKGARVSYKSSKELIKGASAGGAASRLLISMDLKIRIQDEAAAGEALQATALDGGLASALARELRGAWSVKSGGSGRRRAAPPPAMSLLRPSAVTLVLRPAAS